MIARLSGNLIEKKPPVLVVDVAGVGYELEAPMTTFVNLPKLGAQVNLFTHLVVREKAQLLYGFIDQESRNLFRALICSSGVGPKLALTILSGMTASEFHQCIEMQDAMTLVRLPGIGRKTAERLLVEMRDRLPEQSMPIETAGSGDKAATPAVIKTEAENALRALGYVPAQARRAVNAVWVADMTLEQTIMAALKSMLS